MEKREQPSEQSSERPSEQSSERLSEQSSEQSSERDMHKAVQQIKGAKNQASREEGISRGSWEDSRAATPGEGRATPTLEGMRHTSQGQPGEESGRSQSSVLSPIGTLAASPPSTSNPPPSVRSTLGSASPLASAPVSPSPSALVPAANPTPVSAPATEPALETKAETSKMPGQTPSSDTNASLRSVDRTPKLEADRVATSASPGSGQQIDHLSEPWEAVRDHPVEAKLDQEPVLSPSTQKPHSVKQEADEAYSHLHPPMPPTVPSRPPRSPSRRTAATSHGAQASPCPSFRDLEDLTSMIQTMDPLAKLANEQTMSLRPPTSTSSIQHPPQPISTDHAPLQMTPASMATNIHKPYGTLSSEGQAQAPLSSPPLAPNRSKDSSIPPNALTNLMDGVSSPGANSWARPAPKPEIPGTLVPPPEIPGKLVPPPDIPGTLVPAPDLPGGLIPPPIPSTNQESRGTHQAPSTFLARNRRMGLGSSPSQPDLLPTPSFRHRSSLTRRKSEHDTSRSAGLELGGSQSSPHLSLTARRSVSGRGFGKFLSRFGSIARRGKDEQHGKWSSSPTSESAATPPFVPPHGRSTEPSPGLPTGPQASQETMAYPFPATTGAGEKISVRGWPSGRAYGPNGGGHGQSPTPSASHDPHAVLVASSSSGELHRLPSAPTVGTHLTQIIQSPEPVQSASTEESLKSPFQRAQDASFGTPVQGSGLVASTQQPAPATPKSSHGGNDSSASTEHAEAEVLFDNTSPTNSMWSKPDRVPKKGRSVVRRTLIVAYDGKDEKRQTLASLMAKRKSFKDAGSMYEGGPERHELSERQSLHGLSPQAVAMARLENSSAPHHSKGDSAGHASLGGQSMEHLAFAPSSTGQSIISEGKSPPPGRFRRGSTASRITQSSFGASVYSSTYCALPSFLAW